MTERRQASGKVVGGRERALLDFVLAASDDAIACMAHDGTLIAWSKSAERLFGYTEQEMLGKKADHVFPMLAAPEIIAEEKGKIARAAMGEEIAPYESVRTRRDGTTVRLLISAKPIRDAGGKIVAVARIARDITHVMAHEQDKALLGQIIQSSSDAIISYTLDGTVTSWNPAAERIYGFTAAEMIGTSLKARLDEFVLPERSAAELQISDRLVAGEYIAPFETVRLRKDGTKINVLVSVSAIRDSDGKVVGVSRIVRDLSEHKAAEMQRALFGSIVECSNDAIYTKTLDGTVTTWNPAAEKLFGYTAEQIIGRPVLLLFDPKQVAEEVGILARINRGETIRHYETVRLRKDGARIDVSVTVSPIRDPAGVIIGVSNIVRDVTDRKQFDTRLKGMQDDLAHVARLNELGQVSAGIAHELNQPLAALLNYANLAKRALAAGPPAGAERATEALVKVCEQAIRAGEIVRRMRSFVEKRQSNRTFEDMNAVVKDSIELGLIGANAANVTTRLELDPDLPDVLADRVQLQQVLVNLLHNAIDAMANSPKREVTVKTGVLNGDTVEVLVADTGPGIPREHLDRLFMPFFTTKPGGMGIGLVISRSIVEAHGGNITVEPNRGGGTVFRFTLPAARSI